MATPKVGGIPAPRAGDLKSIYESVAAMRGLLLQLNIPGGSSKAASLDAVSKDSGGTYGGAVGAPRLVPLQDVPAAPSPGALYSGGGRIHLIRSTKISSSVANVEFPITSRFGAYMYILSKVAPVTNAQPIQAQVKVGGSWATGSGDYLYLQHYVLSTGGHGTVVVASNYWLMGTGIVGNGTGNNVNTIGFLFAPTSGLGYNHYVALSSSRRSDNLIQHDILSGYGTTTGAIQENPLEGIRFYFASGNIASGSISFYGIPEW